MVLVSPNQWCLNHLTKNKIYNFPDYVVCVNGTPVFNTYNDIGMIIDAPMHCFETLQNTRLMKLEKLKWNKQT